MGRDVKGLAILGSTGSVGTQTLDIVRAFPDEFNVVGLTANRSLDLLATQVAEFGPAYVASGATPEEFSALSLNGTRPATLDEIVTHPDVDLVVTATVGDVALGPTVAAIMAGKNIAIANKESVVLAGHILTALASEYGVELFPVDSEPNAIWQCIRGEDKTVSKLIITASGGAFRDYDPDELAEVTPEQALNHPTWTMGPRITVDSATLMNKALEVIEAHWLFDMDWDDIEVVIHPQSIIHSMVEFVDGSVKAQISPPDMHLPIQYALFYPDRVKNADIAKFDPVAVGALTFVELDPARYPCYELALDFGRRGGTWPAALCGADEIAVDAFLSRKIRFTDIPVVIAKALEKHRSVDAPTIDQALAASSWAKSEVARLVEV